MKRRRTKALPAIVYVVDDDTSIRRAVSRMFLLAGYAVETFASAAEFLAYPRSGRPACLVLDLWLPGMGGIELQQQLVEAGDPLPVVVITGLGDQELTRRALAGGALAVLDKPFEDEHLLAEIKRALSLGKGAGTPNGLPESRKR